MKSSSALRIAVLRRPILWRKALLKIVDETMNVFHAVPMQFGKAPFDPALGFSEKGGHQRQPAREEQRHSDGSRENYAGDADADQHRAHFRREPANPRAGFFSGRVII